MLSLYVTCFRIYVFVNYVVIYIDKEIVIIFDEVVLPSIVNNMWAEKKSHIIPPLSHIPIPSKLFKY